MTQIIDSNFGAPKVGMTVYRRTEIDRFSRQHTSWIRYRIEHHLETMAAKQAVMLVAAEVEADKKMRHRPEPFELTRYQTQASGETLLTLKGAGMTAHQYYSTLSKSYIPGSLTQWVIEKYSKAAERLKPKVERRVRNRKQESDQKKIDELKEAKALIKADSQMNPKIQSARMKMPSYAARINKAAAIINAAR